MKKFISAIASAVMLTCFSAVPLTAHADNGITFEAGKVSTTGAVENGVLVQEETVIVPVNITENQGVASFLLEFTQDSNIEITAAKTKDSDYVSSKGISGGFTWNVDALRLLWIENSCNDVDVCGVVVNLEVKVPAGTPVGQYEIGFNAPEIQVTNTNFDSIEFTLVPGYVEVGGNPADNPPVQTEPAATQPPATQPPATQAPATQPPATQAPATQAAAEQPANTARPPMAQAPANTTKAEETTKTETTNANNAGNTDKSETTTANPNNSDIVVTATQTDTDGNIVTDADGNIVIVTVNESGTSSETASSDKTTDSNSTDSTDNSGSEKSDSKSDDNSKDSSSKKKNSPSTGVSSGEIAVLGVILTVSAAGAVIAFKNRKDKKNK